MAEHRVTLFLAGDAMIVRPWSHVENRSFRDLVARMRATDAAIVNLETVIHEFRDYAQAQSGGDWLASPPSIAAELTWAGIDMVAHANNHAFDYGAGGLLETLRHVEAAGLILSGSGADLQAARAPRYLRCAGGTVAHVAMASTFVPYGRASRSRADIAGRPGVNPLALRTDRVLRAPPLLRRVLSAVGRLMGNGMSARLKRALRVGVAPGSRLRLQHGQRPVGVDAKPNLAAIREATNGADVVVASLHAHEGGPWLRKFARRAIAAGACTVIVHGPHEVRGVEIVDGRPVFYGLGDFVYEPHAVAHFPQEIYDRLGLPDSACPDDARALLRDAPLSVRRETFEGAAAILQFEAGRCTAIQLLPIDLQFDAAQEARGRPRLADPELGRRIIARIAARSAPFGTTVRYDEDANAGSVTNLDRG
jgi:poly-gamma-glutamate synthesis protein (capsule biosynthesis protein)